MLLAIAFLMFVLLVASWIVVPDTREVKVSTTTPPRSVESGTVPVRI